jgi:uncharacterized phiE125 gp8 family phage protein
MITGLTPTVLVPPTAEPITLAEAKVQVKMEPGEASTEDDYLLDCIAAAREWCEGHTGRSFYEQTLQVSLDDWPRSRVVELPRATPLRSITSVTYRDSDETEQNFADLAADTASVPGRLLITTLSSPSLSDICSGRVKVVYVAGQEVGSPQNTVPRSIKQAVKLLVGHLYYNREAVVIGNPAAVASAAVEFGVAAFLSQHRASYEF